MRANIRLQFSHVGYQTPDDNCLRLMCRCASMHIDVSTYLQLWASEISVDPLTREIANRKCSSADHHSHTIITT